MRSLEARVAVLEKEREERRRKKDFYWDIWSLFMFPSFSILVSCAMLAIAATFFEINFNHVLFITLPPITFFVMIISFLLFVYHDIKNKAPTGD